MIKEIYLICPKCGYQLTVDTGMYITSMTTGYPYYCPEHEHSKHVEMKINKDKHVNELIEICRKRQTA